MKKLLGAVLIAGTAILGGAQTAHAGGATNAALALGAFAVFNQLVRGETVFQGWFPPAAPVVVAAPPAPVIQQPVVVPQPVIVQQPVIITQPVVVPQPVVIAQPVVVPQPVVIPQVVIGPAPVVVAPRAGFVAPPARFFGGPTGPWRAHLAPAPRRVPPGHVAKRPPHWK